jgi:hypothetical protein
MSRVVFEWAGEFAELVPPRLGHPSDTLIQGLAQAPPADGTVEIAGRPGADELPRLVPGTAGPGPSFGSSAVHLDLPFQAVEPALDLVGRDPFRPTGGFLLDLLEDGLGLQARIAHDLGHHQIDPGGTLGMGVDLPIFHQPGADFLRCGSQEQSPREPDPVCAEPTERAAAEFGWCCPNPFQSRAERGRQVVGDVSGQVGDDVPKRLGRPLRHGEQVGCGKRQPPTLHLWAFRPTVVGHERDVRVGIVVQLGQGGVQVCQFVVGGSRVGRGRSVHKRRGRSIRSIHPREHTANCVAEIDQHPPRSSGAAGEHEHLGDIVPGSQSGLVGRLGHRFRVGGDLEFPSQAGHKPQVVIAECQPTEGARSTSLKVPGDRVQFLSGEPVENLFELPPTVSVHRLEWDREHLIRGECRVRRGCDRLADRVWIAVHIQKPKSRNLSDVPKPIDEPTPDLLQGPATETSDPDQNGRPEDSDLLLNRGDCKKVVFVDLRGGNLGRMRFSRRGGWRRKRSDPTPAGVGGWSQIDVVGRPGGPHPRGGVRSGSAAATVPRPRTALEGSDKSRTGWEPLIGVLR